LSEDESICNPLDTIRYVVESRKIPIKTLKIPQRLLITYQRSTYESAKNLINGKPLEWIYSEAQPFCIGQFNNVEIGVCQKLAANFANSETTAH